MTYLVGTALLILIGMLTLKVTTRAGYESAEYKVIESDGKFEIREYPDLVLASTTTNSDAQGRDGSFMKLFGYISGENESKQKISMTTPVFMEKDETTTQMGFVMPKDVAAAGTPQPKSQGVAISKRAGGRFAVIRFSGRLNDAVAKEYEAELRQWMATKNLSPAPQPPGSPEATNVESAAYDPPFTPGPLRRNEVLIRLQSP